MTKEVEALIKKIAKKVQIMSWVEIKELGINQQTAIKLRAGEIPAMRTKSLARLKEALNIA